MLSEIWRYPMKSCGGEALSEVHVRSDGLSDDRSWAVVDIETGFVASVKRPSLWAGLLSVETSVGDGHIRVVLPDGTVATTENRESLDKALSSYLNRQVAVRPAAEVVSPAIERTDPDHDTLFEKGDLNIDPPTTGSLGAGSAEGTVFDYATIHIITTPTLSALEGAGEPTAGDPRRFRPNFVVDLDGPPFQENDWHSCHLALGDQLVLEVMIPTPRCIVPTLAQRDLVRDPSALRAVASLNRIEIDGFGTFSCAGVYASVQQAGLAKTGAEFSIRPATNGPI